MSDLDRLIQKNPAVLDLVRRFDLGNFKTSRLDVPSTGRWVTEKIQALRKKLAAQYT